MEKDFGKISSILFDLVFDSDRLALSGVEFAIVVLVTVIFIVSIVLLSRAVKKSEEEDIYNDSKNDRNEK